MTVLDRPVIAAPVLAGRSRLRTRWIRLLPAAVIVGVAIVGPWVTPYSATKVVAASGLSPRSGHWFGTDSSGLDVFSRVIAATRNNLLIGLSTAVIATAIGIALGLLIGMNESRRGPLGLLARGLSRSLDLLQAVPAIVVGLVLVAFFGASVLTLTIALAVVLLPNQGRLVRTEVLRVRNEPYLDAARMSGDRELTLTVRHVLPNSAWPALGNMTLVFGAAILLTATLGFLGVGLHPPTPEWGSMISTGASDAAVGRWWPALFPALAIIITVFSFAAVGRFLFEDD